MHENEQHLPPDLAERILSALGFSSVPASDLAGLSCVYAAWCRRVPFDNVRKLIHVRNANPDVLPGNDAQDFFSAWLRHGTGATCWAGNGALCCLLRSLGFAARRGVATMLVAADLAPNHGTVIVTIDAADFVVDASILHSAPLPLAHDGESVIQHPAWGVHCRRANGRWHIRHRPLHMPEGLDCRIESGVADDSEFRRRHESTRAWSPFNFELYARLIRGQSLVGIARGQRVEYHGDGSISQTPLLFADRKRVLVEELGIDQAIVDSLPDDLPTPPPPGSRSAGSQSGLRPLSNQ